MSGSLMESHLSSILKRRKAPRSKKAARVARRTPSPSLLMMQVGFWNMPSVLSDSCSKYEKGIVYLPHLTDICSAAVGICPRGYTRHILQYRSALCGSLYLRSRPMYIHRDK